MVEGRQIAQVHEQQEEIEDQHTCESNIHKAIEENPDDYNGTEDDPEEQDDADLEANKMQQKSNVIRPKSKAALATFLPSAIYTKFSTEDKLLQWTVSLARLDIATAVMTMSGYRANPRKGHLDRVKQIIGYCHKFKQDTAKPLHKIIGRSKR